MAAALNDPLQQLEDWAGPLLDKLDPRAQRELARTIARELRRTQVARIRTQRNPDGTAYEPRKKTIRNQRGQIRAMFAKLSTSRHLKLLADPHGSAIGITGRAARIALVHQHGITDQVAPGGPRIQYPRREILGFADADRELIRDMLLKHLVG
jgi:phage virion morphogenesis protein